MASGMGTRFGGNKLMAKLNGIPLIQHVIQSTEGLFAKRVVVTKSEEIAKLCNELSIERILHSEPHRNDTVRLGMKAMDGCSTVTFFQGDQPLISRNSIEELLHNSNNDLESIWRASFDGTPGAPILFPAWTFDELCALPSSKGGGFVAKMHPNRVRTIEVLNEWELFDVDTVEDLEKIQEYAKS